MTKKPNLYVFSYRSSREIGGVSTYNRHLFEIAKKNFDKIYDIHLTSSPERLVYPRSEGVAYHHLGSSKNNGYSWLEKYRCYKKLVDFFAKTQIEGSTLWFSWPGFLLACPEQVLKRNSVIIAQHSSLAKYNKDLRFIRKKITPLINEYVSFYPCFSEHSVLEMKKNFGWKTNFVPIGLIPAHEGLAEVPKDNYTKKVVYIGRINQKEKQILNLLKIFALIPKVKFNIYGPFENNKFKKIVDKYHNLHTNIQYCGITQNPERVVSKHSAFIVSDPDEPSSVSMVEGFYKGIPVINFSQNMYAKNPTNSGCGINVDYNDLAKTAQKIYEFVSNANKLKDASKKAELYYNNKMKYETVAKRIGLVLNYSFLLTAT